MRQPLIPIAFPQSDPPVEGTTLLVADVGGTKTDLGFFEIKNGAPVLSEERRYATAEWRSPVDLVRDFAQNAPLPQRLCISFAGPVRGGRAHGTNLPWDIDSGDTSRQLGIPAVLLLNDLEANCYGLAALQPEDLRSIYPGQNAGPGNAAVLSPGTGLGEGGLFWDGRAYRPFATEGGHAHFAARDELDWELYLFLQKKYGHVSWERVISGPGICMIFNFLHEQKGWAVPQVLKQAMKNRDAAAAISIAAAKGCATCAQALRLFMKYLAEEAANLVLKLKATGGLYLGGGILPQIWNEEYHAVFKEYFFAVGRLHPLVEATPVYLILNQKTALWGAAYYGSFG